MSLFDGASGFNYWIGKFNINSYSGVSTFAEVANPPSFMACDKNGDVFASYGGNIMEYNTNGVGRVFASGLDSPRALAFQPVPEPSTWAMLAMGIGVILSGPRLHRRSS